MGSSRSAKCCRSPPRYWRHAARQRNLALHCVRERHTLIPHMQRVWQANMQVYGADKVWMQMNREGITVARCTVDRRCTVERLMRGLGLRGVIRGKVGAHHDRGCQGGVPAGPCQSCLQSESPQPTLGL